MTPRYNWTPASEPPDDDRNVLVWRKGDAEFGSFSDGIWTVYGPPWEVIDVTHWRDVEPPEAGEIAPRGFIAMALNRHNPRHTAHFRESAAELRHTPTASPRTAATPPDTEPA